MKKIVFILLLIAIAGCAKTAPVSAPSEHASMPVQGMEENVSAMEEHRVMENHTMEEPPVMVENKSEPAPVLSPPAASNASAASDVKEFFVDAFQFGYEPSEIKVKKGDKVKIHLHTRDVGHSLNLRDFKINIMANPGTDGEREFVADKAGSFRWRCTLPCGHGHDQMSGTLVVE